MNKFFIVLMLVFSFGSQATEIEAIYDAISLYQQEMRIKFGKEIHFQIVESPERNAYASFQGPNGAPLINITTEYLKLFEDYQALNSICHEIGHFLGETSFANVYDVFAIESEADYFGGKCLVRYFKAKGMSLAKAQEAAVRLARESRSRVRQERLNADRARLIHFRGINEDYAGGDCRVLSVVHGAMGWRRPSCWYNP